MKNKFRLNVQTGSFPAGALFLLGFLIGTILPNLLWKDSLMRDMASSFYLLTTVHAGESEKMLLFREILKMRGPILVLEMLCGLTIFGVPLSVLGMVLCGGWIGFLLTMSVLTFGLYGGIIGLGLLLPQYLLYLPALFLLLPAVYAQSLCIWRKRGSLPGRMYPYLLAALLAGGIYVCGMILEAYINPGLLEVLFNRFPIFG
jgi:stage II sporulation protein M